MKEDDLNCKLLKIKIFSQEKRCKNELYSIRKGQVFLKWKTNVDICYECVKPGHHKKECKNPWLRLQKAKQ